MAAGAPVSIGTGTNAVSSTTVTIAVSGTPPIGSMVFVLARFNTTQTVASCTITDTAGNTWTIRTLANANEIYGDAIVASDLTGATITITGSAAATAKVAIGFSSTNMNGASRFGAINANIPFFQGTARNIGGNTVTPTRVGDLVIGLWSLDTTETAMSAGTGYTIGPTWTGTGYYTASTLSLAMVYQIVTTLGAKEPIGTGGASPTAYGAANIWYRAAYIPDLNFAQALG